MNTLPQIGAALYGSRWQTDLAAVIGVTDRTVRRWLAAPESVPDYVWRDLRSLCRQRAQVLANLAGPEK